MDEDKTTTTDDYEVRTVVQEGDSLRMNLPSEYAKALGIKAGDRVIWIPDIEEGRLILRKLVIRVGEQP